jgi:hypothetical protein
VSTTRGGVAAPPTGFWDRQNELFRGMIQAVIADETAFADVPRSASIILIPSDADDAFLQASVEVGLDALRKGLNVYLRHVAPDELSADAEPELVGSIEDYFVKREHFDPPIDDEFEAEEPTR